MTQATIEVLKALVKQRQSYLRQFNGDCFSVESMLYNPVIAELDGLSEQKRIDAEKAAKEYKELEEAASKYVVASGAMKYVTSPNWEDDRPSRTVVITDQTKPETGLVGPKPIHESGLLMKGDAKLETRLVKYEKQVLEKLNKLGGRGNSSDLSVIVGGTDARKELNVAIARLVKAKRITRTEMAGRKVVYTLPGVEAEDPNRDPRYRNIVALTADWDGDKAGLLDLLMEDDTVSNMGWDKGDLCRILKSERNFIERLRATEPGDARYRFLQRHYGLGVGK